MKYYEIIYDLTKIYSNLETLDKEEIINVSIHPLILTPLVLNIGFLIEI